MNLFYVTNRHDKASQQQSTEPVTFCGGTWWPAGRVLGTWAQPTERRPAPPCGERSSSVLLPHPPRLPNVSCCPRLTRLISLLSVQRASCQRPSPSVRTQTSSLLTSFVENVFYINMSYFLINNRDTDYSFLFLGGRRNHCWGHKLMNYAEVQRNP